MTNRQQRIIAVDYDGTLYWQGQTNLQLVRALKKEQARKNIVILWTCREGASLRQALADLHSAGFTPNYVNMNCPLGIKLMGHDSRKVFADMYIDDKNSSAMNLPRNLG